MADLRADQGPASPGGAPGAGRPLPPGWRALDASVLRLTELAVVAVGLLFTALVTLEVVSRYLLDFSIALVNAGARMLLVWFFLLGAGLALRRGAHVGFTLLLDSLPPPARRALVLAGQAVVLAFVLLMLWSGVAAIGPSLRQSDPGLGISLAWGMAAVPTGFVLLLYHLAVLAWQTWQRPPDAGAS